MIKFLLFLLCLLPAHLFCETEKDSSELRVLSYNVWYGFTKQPERKKKVIEYVKSLKPDIVSLQELNSYTEEKLAKDARSWGHPHSALLKTGGFPTGITSRFPIKEISRTLEGYHHGLLSCKTGGVRVYVVHLHPGHWQIRHREVDLLIRELAKRDPSEKILLAGDFNTFSSRDRKQYEKSPDIIPFFRRIDQRWKSNRNLREDQLDYTHLEKIEKGEFVDLVAGKRARFLGTFPTKNRPGEDNGPSRRLDYFFANGSLASLCKSAVCLVNDETSYLSDHYPVLAVFSLGNSKTKAEKK
jgi:exodeoxyribonuclease III